MPLDYGIIAKLKSVKFDYFGKPLHEASKAYFCMKRIPVLVDPADLLILLEDGDNTYDLRNDFECAGFDMVNDNICFLFKAVTENPNGPRGIKLIFENCTVKGWEYKFTKIEDTHAFRFHILSRDRIELSGVLFDELFDGRKSYTVTFDAGLIEFYSESAVAEIT